MGLEVGVPSYSGIGSVENIFGFFIRLTTQNVCLVTGNPNGSCIYDGWDSAAFSVFYNHGKIVKIHTKIRAFPSQQSGCR